jgi:gas vesicle protein
MADSKLPYFFLGLGVGAAVAVLYAPAPGEELREDLRRCADDSRDYLKRRGGELRQQADEILHRGRENAQSQRDQLAAALEAGRRAYREATGLEEPEASEG